MKKMKRIIVILPFFGTLLFFLVLSLINHDISYSPEESRELKTIEKINFFQIGKLPKNLEYYVVDQFPERRKFLKAFSLKDKYLKKKYSRFAYISDDEWIFVEGESRPMSSVPKMILKKADMYPDKEFYYAILPTKNISLREKYSFADNNNSYGNYKRLKENLSESKKKNFHIIDLIPQAASKEFLNDENKWYRTDFHWNALGAKVAADYIIEDLKKEDSIDKLPDQKNISIEPLRGKLYKGDLNRRFSYIYKVDERPMAITSKKKDHYRYYLTEDESKPIKREELVGQGIKDHELDYETLYTPNLAYYRVINSQAANKKSILLIKDSLQNPMIDIFTETFQETKVVDPRMEQKNTFSKMVKDVDIVLLMYHQSHDSKAGSDYLKN